MGPLKTVLIAAALVLGSMPSMALRLANYEAVFEQSDIDPLNILPLGFGRPDGFGRADDLPAPLSLASSGGRSSLALDAAAPGTDAFNPGVLPFGFHDIWTFTGLAPGSYSFNTTLAASGQLAFGLVLYEWYAQGSLQSVDFSVRVTSSALSSRSATCRARPALSRSSLRLAASADRTAAAS